MVWGVDLTLFIKLFLYFYIIYILCIYFICIFERSTGQKHSSSHNTHIMTILESIEQKVAIAVEAINAILPEGYFTTNTISSTNFGNSGYIVIKKVCPIDYIVQICKVRISDHYATNSVRESSEIMIDQLRFNLDELMTRVERSMFPERFEQVEIRTLTGDLLTSNFQVGRKPYTTLTEPTFLGEVIGKKGNLLHSYSWMKEDVRFEWRKK